MIKLLKKWARKILKDEFDKINAERESARKDYLDAVSKYNDRSNEIVDKNNQITILEKQNKNLQERIDIMEKYYGLHEEPTMEEKIQIRIDLKIHDLELRNAELFNQVTSLYPSLYQNQQRYLLAYSPLYNQYMPHHF